MLTVFSVCGDSLVVIFQRKFIALVEPNNSLNKVTNATIYFILLIFDYDILESDIQ